MHTNIITHTKLRVFLNIEFKNSLNYSVGNQSDIIKDKADSDLEEIMIGDESSGGDADIADWDDDWNDSISSSALNDNDLDCLTNDWIPSPILKNWVRSKKEVSLEDIQKEEISSYEDEEKSSSVVEATPIEDKTDMKPELKKSQIEEKPAENSVLEKSENLDDSLKSKKEKKRADRKRKKSERDEKRLHFIDRR